MNPAKKYGYKKKKRQQKSEFVCVEPTRRSVYDILLENMQFLQRNVYVHRIIYIGTHSFQTSEFDNIGKHFRANIEQINSLYCEEFLTGFLLHYSRHFIHVLDGSEDSIKKHLDLLFSTKETNEHLETVKILVVHHNINQRFLTSWMDTFARPPKLLQRIKSDIDATEARNNIIMCLTKLYRFAYLLKAGDDETSQTDEGPSLSQRKHTSFLDDDEHSAPRQSIMPPTVSEYKMNMRVSNTRYLNAIPELQLMEFLVETNHTLDIREYIQCYGSVPLLNTFADFCWPVSTDFIPRNVFDAEYDPVSDVFEAGGAPSDPELINV